MSAPVPAQGQLVQVRSRRYVVSEVAASTMPVDPLRPDGNGRQHLVALTSVDEDGLGEELQVIWEVEPGARVIDESKLPEPRAFDPPARLDAFLDAIRWGAIESADSSSLQAPFRSGISIEDYQLDPVVRALSMPRANLLIADDVGLGKTIEAGLVAQELILRHRARRILVVCPSSLQIKWRDEMRVRFGLEFRIIDSDALKELRRSRGVRVNPWTHFPRLITSVDYLKRERPLRLFRETLPPPSERSAARKYDLLIVDEAHGVAPSGSGNYATDSQRTLAIRTLVPHFEHRLFLTATPHNGYSESFSALLELLDDQRFARDVEPDRKQLEAIMVHRLKSEITNPDGSKRFPDREIEPIEVDYSAGEKEVHEKLRRYSELRQQGADDASGRVATEFVLKLLKKRLFSSPAAFARTLQKHQQTLRGIELERRPSLQPRPGVLKRRLEGTQDEVESDDGYEDVVEGALAEASTMFESLGDEEKRLLRELGDWSTRASAQGDAKSRTLLQWLNATLRPNGEWNDERVIIFTEYRATQNWLLDQLVRAGMKANGRTEEIYGGMDSEAREKIKAAFQTSPRDASVRILLATDAASEGIDLQNYCHRIVHYEIPWNPNRLEQRNGRIDRHGQKKNPLIHHFVSKGWDSARRDDQLRAGDLEGDLEFLMHVALKVDRIRQDLGKVGPVLADQVEQAMLGRRASIDTRAAEDGAKAVRKVLRFERNLQERIARLHARLQESRAEQRVSPENVEAVVRIGLELANQPGLVETGLEGIWPDPTGAREACCVFELPRLRGSWAACAEGLPHPFTGKMRPIVFDHALADGRDDVVLVHMGHRLVQLSQRLLREEIWSSDPKLNRVTARIVPNDAAADVAVIAHARLLVLGGTSHRLHEEVITAGGVIRDGRFARANVSEIRDLLAVATDEVPREVFLGTAQRLWKNAEESLVHALEVRRKERFEGLASRLTSKKQRELDDISAIMDELGRSIREELEAEPPIQQDWLAPEKEQLARNRESLRHRLKSIPDELAREKAAITLRYERPSARLFPVAVTFLVPRKLAH